MNLTIIFLVIFISYFILTFLLMYYTTKFNFTFNYTIFRYQLTNKKDRGIMHYFEMALLTLVLIGFLTTFISLVQILIIKRKTNG